jgi:HTH-type transcriptional regulator/antitoxin HigA
MAIKPLVSDYLVPAGLYLKEALEERNMTQAELAERMGRPAQVVSEIINDKKEITEETAFELATVLGMPAHVWLNLQATYRLGIQREKFVATAEEQADLAAKYPYNDLAKLGLVAKTRNPIEKVQSLLAFFNVAKLGVIEGAYAPAFRKSPKEEACPYALAAWLRMGEREAEEMVLPAFDKVKAKACLRALRPATRCESRLVDAVREVLDDCGIAFVTAPHLPKTYANGATFWHRGRPVLLLSIRGGFEDIYWFTLFHEMGHILLHGQSETFIEGLGTTSAQETEADKFASDTLLPPAAWEAFFEAQSFSVGAVRSFADAQDVSPAVVAGRVFKELHAWGRLPGLQGLRRKLTFA